jgi:radical SAM-linked protein
VKIAVQNALEGESVMKARLKFTKMGPMKFIGHLDLQRLFQRCIRRSHLPIEYSKGFNPHQYLYFALPLPLGATSEGEYLDMTLTDELEPEEIKNSLNAYLPEGINIQEVYILSDEMAVGMAAVDAAEYKIFIDKKTVPLHFMDAVNNFFNQSEILAEKQGKKGIKEVNIKEMIHEYTLDENDEQWIITLLLATGSKTNLKPETVIQQIYRDNNLEYKDCRVHIHRINIYSRKNDLFLPLSDIS